MGLALAVTIARLLASLLFEVSAFDPVALVIAPVLLCASPLVAACAPARQASRAQVLTRCAPNEEGRVTAGRPVGGGWRSAPRGMDAWLKGFHSPPAADAWLKGAELPGR